MNKKYYITAAIPYVNAKPHIGHALEFVQADAIARYHRLLGEETLLLSGGDENALKNVQAAEKEGKEVQKFIDENTEKFLELTKKLNCQFDVWQKGSDQKTHFPASQKLWELCKNAGDIYKKSYGGLYCIGCETFYTKDELNEEGECFEHPGKKLEEVSEENYFFKLSKYENELIQLIESDKLKINPVERKNEVLSFLKDGLEDISISRSNERAKNWGVPVPGDNTQRMYVWFDALNIYQSGVGFGWDEKKYKKWWPADLHVIGKGITRFHAVYWPAFLLSAKLPLPKELFVHGYFTVDGQKMSKTLGNVVDPLNMIEKYGTDALRYYLLAKFSPYNDGDFSEEKLKEVYNGELANGLGNLISRVAKLLENNEADLSKFKFDEKKFFNEKISWFINNFSFDIALQQIWQKTTQLDRFLNSEKPWEKPKDKALESLGKILTGTHALVSLGEIVYSLKPFLPETAEKIEKQFKGPKIKSSEPLFPRMK